MDNMVYNTTQYYTLVTGYMRGESVIERVGLEVWRGGGREIERN